jgi:hypothetical protein
MMFLKEIPLVFKCKVNHIFGILHLPKRKNPPLIIMCHGWGSNKLGTHQGLFVKAARNLCKNGFAVLRFDFRGSGDSEGEFEKQTIETMLEDLNCILNNLDKNYVNTDKIGLIGHSLGGKISILKAAKDKRIKYLALWSTPVLHKEILSQAFVNEVRERKCLWLNDSGIAINIKQLESCLKNEAIKSLKKVRVPMLIVNGGEDISVPPSHAKKIYNNTNKPKKFVIIEGADHAFLNDEHKKILIRTTLSWFKKWLR